MGFYDNKPIAKKGNGSKKAKPGHYPQVLIQKAWINTGGHYGDYFVVEFQVLDNGGDPDLTSVGESVSWTAKLGGKFEYGEAESTEFLATALGLEFEEVGNSVEIRKEALLKNQTQGAVMATTVTKKKTENGYFVTKQTWELIQAPDPSRTAQAAASMVPAPTTPAAPPAAPAAPAPAGVTEEQIRAAGWVPNPNDPSGAYWFLAANPTAPQRTLESLKGGL